METNLGGATAEQLFYETREPSTASALCNARDSKFRGIKQFASKHVTPYGMLMISRGRGALKAGDIVFFGKQWDFVSLAAL
eukprot:869091-Pelagomonas_calceolata.AAC.1